MTPEQVARIRKRLGLTQQELADVLGVSRESVVRWEKGARRVSEPTARLLLRLLTDKGGKPPRR